MLHRTRRLLSRLALLVGLLGGGTPVIAGQVGLVWDPSPDEWVVGYAIHYGTVSGVHPIRVDVGNVTNTVIDGLEPGVTYYFVATAYTADGLESEPSNEVSYTVPNPPEPTNAPPVVDAGPDQTVRLPGGVVLAGQAGDDGLPLVPGQLTAWWELVSGPVPVQFSATNALVVQVGFSEPGVYVFRLVASDGELSATDEVAVRVEPPLPINQAPVVDAGPDQTVRLPGGVVLAGQAGDDGLPLVPGQLTAWWELVSGPAPVQFSATNALVVQVGFSEPGVYVFRLVASDGELSAVDEVVITVQSVTPGNRAPVVRAGPDQTIEVTEAAVLVSRVEDDGLPLGEAGLVFRWEVVTGPGQVEFSAPTGLHTEARFSEPGEYVLRLVASDGELEGADPVTVLVLPAPPPDQYGLVWEAEDGVAQGSLVTQQTGASDSPTNAAAYVQGGSIGSGQVTHTVQVPDSGTYIVWVRGATVDGTAAQVFLSVDGGGEIAGQLQPSGAQNWEWMQLRVVPTGGFYAPPGGTLPPVSLSLNAGARSVSIRLMDNRLRVDKVLITRSAEFQPVAPGAVPLEPVRFGVVRQRGDTMRLVWEATPGAVYRLVYKTRWDDPNWQIASPDLMATGTELIWKDQADPTVPIRLYRVQRVY
jgi:hypothetical protein